MVIGVVWKPYRGQHGSLALDLDRRPFTAWWHVGWYDHQNGRALRSQGFPMPINSNTDIASLPDDQFQAMTPSEIAALTAGQVEAAFQREIRQALAEAAASMGAELDDDAKRAALVNRRNLANLPVAQRSLINIKALRLIATGSAVGKLGSWGDGAEGRTLNHAVGRRSPGSSGPGNSNGGVSATGR